MSPRRPHGQLSATQRLGVWPRARHKALPWGKSGSDARADPRCQAVKREAEKTGSASAPEERSPRRPRCLPAVTSQQASSRRVLSEDLSPPPVQAQPDLEPPTSPHDPPQGGSLASSRFP